jgi:hypothetical protein
MTCRHSAYDPNCSSFKSHEASIRKAIRDEVRDELTPDADKYEVIDAEPVGAHLVMRVRYPNCAKCAYEGVKILVFLNVPVKDALKWKRIDPHFRGDKHTAREAPSPAARFPASDQGWQDAMDYARTRT